MNAIEKKSAKSVNVFSNDVMTKDKGPFLYV